MKPLLRIQIGIALLLGTSALLFSFLYLSNHAFGSILSDQNTVTNTYRVYDLLASTTAETTVATSTSATSTNIVAYADSNGRIITGAADIRGAKKVDLFFTRGSAFGPGVFFGTTTFSVQVSNDGTNWYYFNRLVVSTSSPASTFSNAFVALSDPTIGIPPTIGNRVPGGASTSTLHYSMDLSTEGFNQLRCIAASVATGTPDGANSCQVGVTY